jgi:hypothetical protein
MAAISIKVNNEGLFNIGMDQWEWTGLKVNGQNIPFKNNQWFYQQPTPGLIQFTATANLTATNPGNSFIMTGDNGKDYACILWYGNNPFELHGVLFETTPGSTGILGAGAGPFAFTQGNMTGSFSKI